jgi:hypothetical protein
LAHHPAHARQQIWCGTLACVGQRNTESSAKKANATRHEAG